MKLSAPPPPPPPPPGDENPESGAPDTPEPAPEAAPVVPGATTALEARPMQWPSWANGIDSALAALVLVFAFAAASFVARNSDVWLHLAAGKRLFAGEYFPGSDPFSYAAADRAWVNHAWLTDAAAYLLYGGEGNVLVIAKALVVVLAFGLLLGIRRPRHALWPWAMIAAVAVLAAAPQFMLRPLIVSMLFLALTLYLLFQLPQRTNSWRFPVAIGVTFWFWSNSDSWFFIGPLALLLVLVGELIQTKVLHRQDEADADAEPLGRLPDVPTLVKALVIGVLACMLNPHHVRVWELPFELIGTEAAQADPRLQALLVAPYQETYYRNETWGYNLNGLAFAALFIGGAVLLGFGYARMRASHILLWLGSAALAILSVFAIPFFAIVAVPLIAAQLNAFSLRIDLKTWGDPKSRLLWIGTAAGRIACLLLVCALCVITYPGWVHPESSNPAFARRVAWGVEADPLLKKAAEQLNQWRETNQLPADARGVITGMDLANYAAWYAPREKVFVNARYNHHRPELPDFVKLRQGLGLIRSKDAPASISDAEEVLSRTGAVYLAISSHPAENFLSSRELGAVEALYGRWSEWSPWYLDGRTTIFGWQAPGKPGLPSFKELRLDPVALAFDPRNTGQPDPELKLPLPPDWSDAFITPGRIIPGGSVEANGWLRYKEGVQRRTMLREVSARLVNSSPALAMGWHPLAAHLSLRINPNALPPTDPDASSDEGSLHAAAYLALWSVRRAILEDPDHPESYFMLAEVLKNPHLPLSPSERIVGQIIALRQCLARMPDPENYRRGQLTIRPMEVAFQLATIYLGEPLQRMDPKTGKPVVAGFSGIPIDLTPFSQMFGQAIFNDQGNVVRKYIATLQLDPPPKTAQLISDKTPFFLAADTALGLLELAMKYAPEDTRADTQDVAQERRNRVESLLKDVEGEVIRGSRLFSQAEQRGAKAQELIYRALLGSLAGKALELLESTDLMSEFGQSAAHAQIQRVALELLVGRIENANTLLYAEKGLAAPENAKAIESAGLSPALNGVRYHTALMAGEYRAAGSIWEVIAGHGVGSLDKLPPFGPDLPDTFITDTLASLIAGPQTPPAEAERHAKRILLALRVPPLTPLTPLTQPITYHLWRIEWAGIAQLLQQHISSRLEADSNFFFRRGLLSMLAGDIPAAKTRFQQATRKPPAGWGLPNINTAPESSFYLMLIERAEKKAAALPGKE